MSTSNLTRSPKRSPSAIDQRDVPIGGPSVRKSRDRRSPIWRAGRRVRGPLGNQGAWRPGGRAGSRDALFPSMPRSALQQVPVDFTASISEIPALLARLCKGQAMEEHLHKNLEAPEGAGYLGFTCPECHCPLSETRRDPVEFRCRAGHTFSTRMLLDGNASVRERKL